MLFRSKSDYNNIVEIIPKNALNQELMNKAAKMREDMINNESNEIQKAINELNPDEKQKELSDNFTDNFKNKLVETFNQEYVKTGLISKNILDCEINKWINDI